MTETIVEADGKRFKYRLKNTGESSAKFGPCEICGGHVSEVHYQSEAWEHELGQWTHFGTKNYFGHKDCVLEKRSEATPAPAEEAAP